MFGKKQKEENRFDAVALQNDDEVNVHTMQDDLANPDEAMQTPPLSQTITTNTPSQGRGMDTLSQTPAQTPPQESPNPFLDAQNTPSDAPPVSVENSFDTMQQNSDMPDNTTQNMQSSGVTFGEPEKSKERGLLSIFLIVLAIILVLAVAGGGYYFWQKRTKETAQGDVTVGVQDPTQDATLSDQTDTIDDMIDVVEQPQQEYVESLPNYLIVDTENSAIEQSINKKFNDIKAGIELQNPTQAVEFVVADTNNVPISFASFAAFTQMTLPADLLATTDEHFSLFAANDEGRTYFGIAVDVTDPEAARGAMGAAEASLAQAISPLFTSPQPSTLDPGIFSDSIYRDLAIRYLNLDTASVDYAVHGNKMIIGTSKNTMRSIIEKILSEAAPSTTQPDDALLNDEGEFMGEGAEIPQDFDPAADI